MSKQQKPPIAVDWRAIPLSAWPLLAPLIRQRGRSAILCDRGEE